MERTQRALAWLGGAAVLAALLVAGGHRATAQTPDKEADKALFSDTFETDPGSWTALGPNGKVGLTTDAAHVKNGKSALEFTYRVGAKADAAPADANGIPIDVLMRPTPDGALTRLHTLRFWARSDDDIPLVVTLSEKGGGRYVAIVWLPKDTWQQITLAPGDFWLSDDKNDPPDPDGKLDLDQVENVGVANLWSLLALGAGDKPPFVSRHIGVHTLWLDDFTASSEPLSEGTAPPADAKGIYVDDLRRSELTWLPIGTMQFQRVTDDNPLKGPALRLDYTQAQGIDSIVALAHDMHRFNFSKTDHLAFMAASQQNATLLIQLEEKGGAKYNATVDLPVGGTAVERTVAFSDFKLADDSPADSDGHLDLDQLKTMTILDLTGLLGSGQGKNTLWLGPIRALAPGQ